MGDQPSSRNISVPGYSGPERRSGKDRRQRPTSPLTLASLRGSRGYARRAEDRDKHHFVDVYSPAFLFAVVVVLVLCIADALLTLRLMEHGAQEINPVMAFCMHFGPVVFIITKYLLTAFGMLSLVVVKNCTLWGSNIRANIIVFSVPVLYAALIVYETVLLVLA